MATQTAQIQAWKDDVRTTNTSTRPIPLCKHWARSKSCLYHSNGAKCKFDHPDGYQIPPSEKSGATSQSGNNNDNSHRHRSAGGRLKVRNDTRVAKFRSFVASHMIHPLAECRILDVAGGKGELAFQLLNLSDASTCHVIDPRPLSLGRFQKRLQRGFYHRSAAVLPDLMRDIKTVLGDPERPVGHLRCFFSHELWDNNNCNDDDDDDDDEKNDTTTVDDFEKNCKNTKAWSWPPKGGNNEHCSDAHGDCDDHHPSNNNTKAPTEPTATIPPETPTFEHASTIVKQANLIVGMHPDQAVDAIVDAALVLDVSFFVVPCCTYSQEFPHRRVMAENDTGNMISKHVTKYEELLDYLQSKSPDIQREVLPFEGKNVCLYRIANNT